MFLSKVKATAAVVLLAAAALGAGAGAVWRQAPATAAERGRGEGRAHRKAGRHWDLVEVPSQRDGVLLFIGTDIKGGDKVAPGRTVTVKVGGAVKKYRRLEVGDQVEGGQLLARVDDRLGRD